MMERLNALNAERDELYRQLNAAVTIQDIWADAFKDGMRCGERALLSGYGEVKKTWLQRTDGARYPLTIQQFETLQGFRNESDRAIGSD